MDVEREALDAAVMQQLLELDEGGTGLLEEMAELFREDTPGRIETLELLVGEGRLSELADVAHAIKGAASTMGAPKVRAVAAALEQGSRKGAFEAEPATLVASLKVLYVEAMGQLDAFIAERRG